MLLMESSNYYFCMGILCCACMPRTKPRTSCMHGMQSTFELALGSSGIFCFVFHFWARTRGAGEREGATPGSKLGNLSWQCLINHPVPRGLACAPILWAISLVPLLFWFDFGLLVLRPHLVVVRCYFGLVMVLWGQAVPEIKLRAPANKVHTQALWTISLAQLIIFKVPGKFN